MTLLVVACCLLLSLLNVDFYLQVKSNGKFECTLCKDLFLTKSHAQRHVRNGHKQFKEYKEQKMAWSSVPILIRKKIDACINTPTKSYKGLGVNEAVDVDKVKHIIIQFYCLLPFVVACCSLLPLVATCNLY